MPPKKKSTTRKRTKSTKSTKRTSKKCPTGKIKRNAYVRSNGTRVKAACTKNMGAPGKTPNSKKVLPKLKKEMLTRYGYEMDENILNREKAIRKAMGAEGELPVYRRLVVLRTYRGHNKQSPVYKRVNRDVKYAKELFDKSKEKEKKGGARKVNRKVKRKSKTTKTKIKTKRKVKVKTKRPKSALKKRKTKRTKSTVRKRVRFRV